MKKALSFILVFCMALILAMPTKAFAANFDTSTKIYSATEIVSLTATGNVVIDGFTFENGAWLYIDAKGHDVTISNCTFSGHPSTLEYACAIYNAGNVTLTGNTFTGTWRGFNVVSAAGTTPSVTATGNTITLEKINVPAGSDSDLYRNVGIQLAGPNWVGSKISITGNTFTNAYTAIRIHDSFSFLTGTADTKMTITPNTIKNVTSYIGLDPNYISEQGDKGVQIPAALEAVLVANPSPVAKNTTEVTASADPTYTIVIPASVDFGKLQRTDGVRTLDFTVSTENVFIEQGKEISVGLSTLGPLTMSNGKGDTLGYVLYGAPFNFTGNGSIKGSVQCNPAALTRPGSYVGYMTFDISMN